MAQGGTRKKIENANAKAPTLSDRSLAPYRQSLTVGYQPFDGFGV